MLDRITYRTITVLLNTYVAVKITELSNRLR